jgi:hypothetical protein
MSARVVRVLEIGMFPVLWFTKRLLSVPALWWKRTGLAMVSASFGVVVYTRFFVSPGTLGDDRWSSAGSGLSAVALGVCILVLYLLGLWVVNLTAVAALRRVARLLPTGGNGALAVARHTLESHHPLRMRAFVTSRADLANIAFIAALMSGYAAAFTIESSQADQASALTFDAVVMPSGTVTGTSSGIGVDHRVMNAAVISSLEADPNLAVVPFGQVTVGPVNATVPTASIMVVSPGDLDRVAPDGARPLGFQDGVMLSPDLDEFSRMLPAPTGLLDVTADARTATLFHRTWLNPATLATRPWAEATWGDVPVVGALVTYGGGDLPVADELGYIDAAARRLGADVLPAPVLAEEDVSFHQSQQVLSLTFLGVMGVFVMVAAGIGAVVLSGRTIKAHRRVRATVAALGATPRSLALSVPIDAGITHAVAFAIGLPLGVIVAVAIKHPTLLAPGAPLDPGTMVWGLWWNLSHVAWGAVAAVAGAAWFLVIVATTVYGFKVARRTPVDELRVAIKEGAL